MKMNIIFNEVRGQVKSNLRSSRSRVSSCWRTSSETRVRFLMSGIALS